MKHLRLSPCGLVEPNLYAQALRFVANHLHRCFFRGRGRAPQTVYRPKLSAACKQIASNCQVLVSCNYQVFPLPWETFRASQNQAGGGPGPNPGRNLGKAFYDLQLKFFGTMLMLISCVIAVTSLFRSFAHKFDRLHKLLTLLQY